MPTCPGPLCGEGCGCHPQLPIREHAVEGRGAQTQHPHVSFSPHLLCKPPPGQGGCIGAGRLIPFSPKKKRQGWSHRAPPENHSSRWPHGYSSSSRSTPKLPPCALSLPGTGGLPWGQTVPMSVLGSGRAPTRAPSPGAIPAPRGASPVLCEGCGSRRKRSPARGCLSLVNYVWVTC